MTTDPATILLVEDDPSLSAALISTLKAAGYRPVPACTAAEGLRWFAHYAPDLVLLDLGLPDRDGLEVIREIRRRAPTPIVVLSARETEAMKVQALDLGADDYLQKPFGLDELLARIRAGLRHAVQARGSEPVVTTGPLTI
ncbi:MAG TPA: response regulator transcription factor, partial [Phenylobacterium sp.]|nr:response regulator transcription factor [Phenylobacterium sp.]